MMMNVQSQKQATNLYATITGASYGFLHPTNRSEERGLKRGFYRLAYKVFTKILEGRLKSFSKKVIDEYHRFGSTNDQLALRPFFKELHFLKHFQEI